MRRRKRRSGKKWGMVKYGRRRDRSKQNNRDLGKYCSKPLSQPLRDGRGSPAYVGPADACFGHRPHFSPAVLVHRVGEQGRRTAPRQRWRLMWCLPACWLLHASPWGKRQRTRTGRGRTIEFEGTDADRTRAWLFLPGQRGAPRRVRVTPLSCKLQPSWPSAQLLRAPSFQYELWCGVPVYVRARGRAHAARRRCARGRGG
eukprot:gene22094-biopygen1150